MPRPIKMPRPINGYALSASEAALRPLLRHLCMGASPDTLQPAVLARAQAASERNAWGFAQVGGDNHQQSNAHVVVRVAKL
jgi:hypothetical protein